MRSDVTEFAKEIGRIVGLGDPLTKLVLLLRACASRNAATDMRCEESAEATLAPRGRAGGKSEVGEGDLAGERLGGEVDRDCSGRT